MEKVNKNQSTTCIETDFIGHRGMRDQASAALPYLGQAQQFPSNFHVFSNYLVDIQSFKRLVKNAELEKMPFYTLNF